MRIRWLRNPFRYCVNSKLRLSQCKEVFLFGLQFTKSTSATNWITRSVENFATLPLPETFEELQKVPLNRSYYFLMCLDKNSIDKEISRLGVEARMFWELPKVENALHSMCKRCFFSDSRAYKKTTLDSTTNS